MLELNINKKISLHDEKMEVFKENFKLYVGRTYQQKRINHMFWLSSLEVSRYRKKNGLVTLQLKNHFVWQ